MIKAELEIGFCVKALTVGMKHHCPKGNEGFWLKKISEHIENGGGLQEVQLPITEAMMACGLLGSKKSEAEEKNAPEGTA